MNPLQSKIEQTAKEYLSYKTLVDKEAISAKKEKEQIASKILTLSEEDKHGYIFDTLSPLKALTQDMLQVKAKLYNQIELLKDVVDIPKEILDLVVDYKSIYTFAIIGDEKKLIDEAYYNQVRQNYISYQMEVDKKNK